NEAISGTTTVNNITITGSCIGCGAASPSLSSLSAATTTNSIDRVNWAQVWKWNSLTTQNALTLSSTSMTSGNLLVLSDTSTASTGAVISATNATTTTSGYGIYASLTNTGNTGYAGYFSNASTGGYAVYANG